MRWYNVKSCFRGLMDKALASEASHVGSSPTGNIFVYWYNDHQIRSLQ